MYGTKAYNSTSVGSVVTYICDVGLTLINGDGSRTCSSSGGWSGSAPTCGGMTSIIHCNVYNLK